MGDNLIATNVKITNNIDNSLSFSLKFEVCLNKLKTVNLLINEYIILRGNSEQLIEK